MANLSEKESDGSAAQLSSCGGVLGAGLLGTAVGRSARGRTGRYIGIGVWRGGEGGKLSIRMIIHVIDIVLDWRNEFMNL